MALSTYSELAFAIPLWTHRDDLGSVLPTLIALAEEQISRDLADSPALWKVQGSIAIANGAREFVLPTDAIKLRSARIVELNRDLRIVPIQQIERTGYATATGSPHTCAVAGNNESAGGVKVMVYPHADTDYTVEAVYSALIPALSDSAPTNFLMTRAPSVYLFAALSQFSVYTGGDERSALWEAKYQQAVRDFLASFDAGEMLMDTDVPATAWAGFDITTG